MKACELENMARTFVYNDILQIHIRHLMELDLLDDFLHGLAAYGGLDDALDTVLDVLLDVRASSGAGQQLLVFTCHHNIE